MIIINFSHPLTEAQRQRLELLLNQPITAVHAIPCIIDNGQPLLPQLTGLLASIPLTPVQWQTQPILINPPGLAVAAAALIAELHGRMGHFPALIRIRPVSGSLPPTFEVAEIVNLHAVREKARQQREEAS